MFRNRDGFCGSDISQIFRFTMIGHSENVFRNCHYKTDIFDQSLIITPTSFSERTQTPRRVQKRRKMANGETI